MVRKYAIAGLASAGLIILATSTGQIAHAGEFGHLVDGKGAEETYYACTGCHSDMLVAQQGLSRERWNELIDWMIDEQGMPEIESEERELILEYLSTNYGPDRPNFPLR